jgi:hypothetical protein
VRGARAARDHRAANGWQRSGHTVTLRMGRTQCGEGDSTAHNTAPIGIDGFCCSGPLF